jgi:hypothetical protein
VQDAAIGRVAVQYKLAAAEGVPRRVPAAPTRRLRAEYML